MVPPDFQAICCFYIHEMYIFVQLVAKNELEFCLCGMLKERQRLTLFQFLDALRNILSEKENMKQLEMEVNEALALMKRDFPVDIQVYQNSFIYKHTYTQSQL